MEMYKNSIDSEERKPVVDFKKKGAMSNRNWN